MGIRSDSIQDGLRYCYKIGNDIFYVGNYYGSYYKYDSINQKTIKLGNSGINIYSSLSTDDSTIYLGGYPSGVVLNQNKNKSWTVRTFDTTSGNIITFGDTTNPRLVGYFGSATPARYAHTFNLIKDNNSNIIGSGDVIRIANTTSISGYNPNTNSLFGYDYNGIFGLGVSGLAAWNNLVIYSTNNASGGTPKLYFYSSATNTMVDSITLSGVTDYGNIYVVGNLLVGIAPYYVYKLNLFTKQLIKSYTLSNPINYSFQLTDGRILVNTTEILPTDITQFIKIPLYGSCVQKGSDVYFSNGLYVSRYKNIGYSSNINTAQGRIDYLKRLYQ